MSRRGFTLVEILVVVLMVGTVLSMALTFFYQGQQQAATLDFRLQALQAAYVVRCWLADDLASSLPAPPGQAAVPNAATITLRRVLKAEAPGVAGTSLDARLSPLNEATTYQFDGARHMVLRNGVPVSPGRFLDVTFSYLPFESGVRGETVEVHMTVVPETALDQPGRVDFREQELVSFSFHLPQATLRRAWPEFAVEPR